MAAPPPPHANNGTAAEPANGNDGESLYDKQVFTTGEAAEVCKVSQQTIIRCFDAGRLNGFRVPGSRFRRIPREELIRFMKENDIPLDEFGPARNRKRILIVDDDPHIVDLMVDVLSADGRYEVKAANTGYDAGMLSESFKPDVIVLDYMLPDINGNVVCRAVRNNAELAHTRVIVVSGVVNQQEVDALLTAGADEFLKKPFDIAKLQERIESLLEV
ncbi:MAG: response regulator [Planctomycetota bacterium]